MTALKKSRIFIPAAALALPLLITGCGDDSEEVITRVFIEAPWQGDEKYTYELATEGDDVYGSCTLETDVEFAPGQTKLSRLCGDAPGPHRDDGTSVVESDTLTPVSSSRVQTDAEKQDRFAFTATYEYPVAHFESDENGKKRTTDRDLPEPTEESPDPGYYDDESLLWLVRGIDLTEGYEGSFRNVSAATGAVFTVDLEVQEKEEVEVPAGTFEAWKVRVRTDTVTQYMWVEAAAPHRLVKARVYGLQEVEYALTGGDEG